MNIRLSLNALPQKKAEAIERINAFFNNAAVTNAHREAAWRRKREIAATLQAGGAATAEFSSEAALRGIDDAALADLVLSKPDATDTRELSRQTALIAVSNATSVAELKTIIESF